MNCRYCKKELLEKRRYCNEDCRYNWNKYYKHLEPKDYQRNENYYQEAVYNYGRSSKGKSGGWGCVPNVTYVWKELTKEALLKKHPTHRIKVGTGEYVNVGEALQKLSAPVQ